MPLVRSLAILVAAACLSAGFASSARAQVNTAAVNAAVADLASGDREKVVAGRTALIAIVNAANKNPPAMATLADTLNTQLMPIASGKDPHAKLNVAILIQRLTDQSASTDLAPLITKLIGDSSPAVSAYGLRSASNVLPRMLADAKFIDRNPIVPAIVASVTTHAGNEAVAIEAYSAVVRVLNDRGANEILTPNGVTAATPRAVEVLLPLLSARVAQYGSGTLAEPNAEQPAIGFLGKQFTFNASTPQQRATTVRLLLQLMDATVTELGKVPTTQPNTRIRQSDLRSLIRTAAGTLSVIADLSSKPDLKKPIQDVLKLGPLTPLTEYKQTVAALADEFKKAMPDVPPAAPTATTTVPPTATP